MHYKLLVTWKEQLQKRLKDDYEEDGRLAEEISERIKNANTLEEESDLTKEHEEFLQRTIQKLNAKRDKEEAEKVEEKLSRERIIHSKLKEIQDEYEKHIKTQRDLIAVRKAKIQKDLRNQRLDNIIKKASETLQKEQLYFGINKIIEDQHLKDVSDLLQDHFRQTAIALKEGTVEIFNQKLEEIEQIENEFATKYSKAKEKLNKSKIKRGQEKLKDLELKYIEKLSNLENNIAQRTENVHREELVKVKEDQFEEKSRLIKKYVNEEAVEEVLKEENEHMVIELDIYRARLQDDNRRDIDRMKKEQEQIEIINKENQEKLMIIDSQAKRLLDKQKDRTRERRKKTKEELDNLKIEHEKKLSKKGISEESKKLMIEQYEASLRTLNEGMDKERIRQTQMLQRKLELKTKERQYLKVQRNIDLILYKQHQKEHQLDYKITKNLTKDETNDEKIVVVDSFQT